MFFKKTCKQNLSKCFRKLIEENIICREVKEEQKGGEWKGEKERRKGSGKECLKRKKASSKIITRVTSVKNYYK